MTSYKKTNKVRCLIYAKDAVSCMMFSGGHGSEHTVGIRLISPISPI